MLVVRGVGFVVLGRILRDKGSLARRRMSRDVLLASRIWRFVLAFKFFGYLLPLPIPLSFFLLFFFSVPRALCFSHPPFSFSFLVALPSPSSFLFPSFPNLPPFFASSAVAIIFFVVWVGPGAGLLGGAGFFFVEGKTAGTSAARFRGQGASSTGAAHRLWGDVASPVRRQPSHFSPILYHLYPLLLPHASSPSPPLPRLFFSCGELCVLLDTRRVVVGL